MGEKVVTATVYPNGLRRGGERLMVHSDFKRFLSEAGKKLSIGAIYIFTEEGGEVESTEEILHDDALWVSSGEPFVTPVEEIKQPIVRTPKVLETVVVETKVDRGAEYRKHEALVLQLQQVFPTLSLSELLSSAMLCNYSLDRTIDYLLSAPPTHLVEEPFADRVETPISKPTPPKSNVPKIKVKIFINGEAEKHGVDNGEELSYEQGCPLEVFIQMAGKILKLAGAKRVFTREGGEIGDISEIFPGDELCISCGEPWRPTDEDDDDDEDEEENKKEEVKGNNKKGKVSESLVKELSAILPQFSNERLRETLEKFNGDMDRAMMDLLDEGN